MQSLQLMMVTHYLSSPQTSACAVSSLLSATRLRCKPASFNRLVYRSTPRGSRKSTGHTLNLACSASYNEFSNEDLSEHMEELAKEFAESDDEDFQDKDTGFVVSEIPNESRRKEGENGEEMDFSWQFLPSKLEFLEPNLLGISPEPPDWPERDETARVSIEHKANSVGIPFSLRMIKRKQKWEEGFVDAGEFACCSVKKAFSSMVFIIRELQSYALQLREHLYCEDLQGIVGKVQKDMNASFVWLFQQVFSRTPTLMVYVMILLSNFTIHSMINETLVAATPSPRLPNETIMETLSITEEKNQEELELSVSYSSTAGSDSGGGDKVGLIGSGANNGDWNFSKPLLSVQALPDETPQASPNGIIEGEEEKGLWNSIVEEAARDEVLDHRTMQQLVSPVSVELEPDDYVEYSRTDLVYQMSVAEEPNNPLLLLNYAQFLYLVAQDHDRAEECFKRAIQIEPPDAEALSQYADFLWQVRKDLWGAEERYQQAIAAGLNNPYHAARYANFLWSTGGEETCFPLNTSFDPVL